MRRHHVGSGRSTTTVIGDDWAAHHAGVTTATLNATVTIAPPGAGSKNFDPNSGQTSSSGKAAVYDGRAAISVVSDTDRQLVVEDDPESVRTYEVTLPVNTAGIAPGHVIHVGASADPMLIGRTLRVGSIEVGDRQFSRVLLAILND